MVNGVASLIAVPFNAGAAVARQSSTIARSASFIASQTVAGQIVAKGSKMVSSAMEPATSQNNPELQVSGGFLPGPTAASSPNVAPKFAPQRRVKVTIPPFKNHKQRKGQQVPTFVVALRDGQRIAVKARKGLQPGQQISIMVRDYTKMLASTLQVPPSGAKMVMQKPIEWVTVRMSQEENPDTGILLATAQHRLLKQAHTVGCNAVLGISFNVTKNITGQSTAEVVVTAFGTPCIIVPETDLEGEQVASDIKSTRDDDCESCASFADTAAETDSEAFEG